MDLNDEFRRNLLGQLAPEQERLERYRQEVTLMLDKNERGLRREKWFMTVIWGFGVTLMTVFLLVSGLWHPTPERSWLVCLAMFAMVLVSGALEIVKHFINRGRVEILKEVKQLELRVLEIDQRLKSGG
ncbi:MAG TPA: hypothetical protein VG826_12680 [Pirellulales bacterium]|nr:hypothetical protein [Pirellulales bacterium]